MKKFNFNINNFYSIFSQMPEDKRHNSKDLDSFLNNGIKHSLEDNVSDDFTSEMMKRIALAEEFANEDIKTSKIARYIISGLLSLLVFFVISFSLFFSLNENNKDVSLFNNTVDQFSKVIESFSFLISENLGFTFDMQTAMVFLILMVFVFLFSFSERLLFKKSYK